MHFLAETTKTKQMHANSEAELYSQNSSEAKAMFFSTMEPI